MNPGREKRVINVKSSEGKKPRLVPSELVFADSQKDWLEAKIRSTVAAEVECALSRVFSTFQRREPLKQITEFSVKKLRLQFITNPAAATFTGNPLVDEDGNTICVVLIDTVSNQPVTTGLESVAKLEVVPLMGDFDTPEEQEWSTEEFEAHVVKARQGKGPLLDGDLEVHLQEGMGTLGRICFTDNSRFTRSGKFRLGVRVAQENAHGLMSVREGKSQAFTVKESRGKGYMKHDTPSPTDYVWRLQRIKKDGAYHTKLMQNGINTVGDFLFCLETNPQILEDVFSTMCKKDYQATIDNAKQCVIGDMLYIHQVQQHPYKSLIFNSQYQFMGAETQDRYIGLGMVVDDVEKVCIDGLVKSVYEQWDTNEKTESTAENAAGPSMIGTVNGSLENDMIDAATMLQEAPDGSFSAERVAGFKHITRPDHVEDGDAEEESTSQGQSSGFDVADLSDDLRKQLEGLNSSIADGEVESQVWDVVSEEVFGEAQEANPAASAWWLRIRSAVRCALFLRRARLARPLDLM